MSFDFFKGTITAPTSGTPPFDTGYTGVGFQPKALIFWATKQTAAGSANPHSMCIGWGTGVNEAFNCAVHSDDGAASSNTRRMANNAAAIQLIIDGDGGIDLRGDLKSLDADGFTITWTTRATSNAYIIHYIALGGDDLASTKSGEITLGTSDGDQAFTGVGFQPDFVMLMTIGRTTANQDSTQALLALGAASGASNRFSVSRVAEDNRPTTDTWGRQTASQILYLQTIGGAEDGVADFKSFDADGFTINVAVGDEFNAAYKVFYLALKGGQYDVDVFAKGTGGAPVDQGVTGVGFTPVGLMLFSEGDPNLDANITELELDIGGGDDNNEGATWVGDQDAQGTTNTASRTSTDKILTNGNIADATEQTATDVKTLDADGFTLTHATNSANADQIFYLAFGNAADAGTTVTHTTDALLDKGTTVTHTTDALILTPTTITHTTDAVIKAPTTATHTTDAVIEAITTVTHTTDALIKAPTTATHTTDALLKAQDNTLTHTTDAHLIFIQTLTHTTDALIKAGTTVTHTTDAVITQPRRTHTTDALIKAATTSTHITDALLEAQDNTLTHTTDALILAPTTVTHTTDAVLTGPVTITHTTDALILVQDNTLTHTTDALLLAQDNTTTHTTDAVIEAPTTSTHTTDALLKGPTTATHTTDAVLQGPTTVTHTTDAEIVVEGTTVTHTTDALILAATTVSHTTDALIDSGTDITHTTDALLKAEDNTQTHTTDVLIETQDNALTHTTDAVIQGEVQQDILARLEALERRKRFTI